MNIIFLDIDGILNSRQDIIDGTWVQVHDHKNWKTERVILLDTLCRLTNSLVVISSSWRSINSDPEWWNQQFVFAGASYIEVIGVTPRARNGFRGREINMWLQSAPFEVNYVILDDDSDMYPDQAFVNVDGEYGLTWYDCARAEAILRGKPFDVDHQECLPERNPPLD